ncbi:MAG: sugar-binding protein [Lentisphaeria bacterium]|nr:sugar-binding protein [Lentisphaeria bacterium]
MARLSMASCAVALAVVASALGVERELIVHRFQGEKATITLGGEFPGAEGSYARHQDSDDAAWHGRLSYNLSKGAYVGVILPEMLPEGCRIVTFKVRCSAPNTRIHLKTTDDSKQEHIRRQVVKAADTWTTLSFEIDKFASAWHGPEDDKRIHWPVRALQIGVERNEQSPIGSVDLADLRVFTSASVEQMPSLRLRCESTRFGALFYPDDVPALRCHLESRLPGDTGRYRLSVAVKDWQGREVLRRDSVEAIGVGDTREMQFTPAELGDAFGAFAAVLTLSNDADPKDRQEVTSWFGRLSSANPPPCPWLGTGIHGSHGWAHGDLRFIDIFNAVGIGVVREEFHWQGVEKKRGEYVVSQRMDNFVNRLNERGVRLNLLLSYGNPVYDNPLDPAAYAAWAAFMAGHFRGRVNSFEIWNEPANFAFRKYYGGQRHGEAPWIGKFVELSLAAGAAIREVQPEATIAVCAEDYWPTLKQMIEEGIGPAGNVLSIHPYCHGQPRPEREMFLKDNGKELRALSRKHGGPERVIITEVGWTTYEGDMEYLAIAGGYPRSSYVHQAQYIIRMYLSSRAAGADYALQYDFKNDGPNRSYTEHNFGLVHEDYTPKPSITAIAFLTRLLGQAECVGDLADDPQRYRLYHFDADGTPVVAAYAIEGSMDVVLPKAAFRRLRIFDLQGNDLPVQTQDGDLAITLTETPVYIRGLDVKKLARKLVMELESDMAGKDVALGDSITVTPLLINQSGRVLRQAQCRWTLRDGAAGKELATGTQDHKLSGRIKDGEAFSLPAIVLPLVDQQWQAYRDRRLSLSVSVEASGVTTIRSIEFTLREPLQATVGNIVLHEGRPAIPLNIYCRGTAPLRPRISASAPGFALAAAGDEPSALPPRQWTTLWLRADDVVGGADAALPAAASVEVDIALASGWQYRATHTAYLGVIPRLAAVPALVGDWTQWQAALSVLQDKGAGQRRLVALDGFAFAGEADLHATARLGWHERGLYIAVMVRDDHFFQPYSNSGALWNGDSVQIGLSGTGTRSFVELAVAKIGDSAQCVVTDAAGTGLKAADIAVSCVAAGEGRWLYELCVPWQALPTLKAATGADLRFSMLVNDNDGQGRKGWVELHSGIGFSKDVTRHGLYSLGQ